MAKIEMVGKKFGRLIVIGDAQKYKGGFKYLCRCDCGNKKLIFGHSLRAGDSKSCGCIRRENLIQYNEKYASKRMIENNPMYYKKVLEKMIATKKKNGTLNKKPKKRGGNGKSIPEAQMILAESLGWGMEIPIKTAPDIIPIGEKKKYSHKNGWPTSYKVDIGNIDLKIAIEVDGHSHNGKRRLLDNKKDRFLEANGWKVLRFKNKDIINNLNKCVSSVMEAISCLH